MMKHILRHNIIFNTLVAILFISLNMWALHAGLEETFVALAFFYGLITIIGNALFFLISKKK